MSEVKQRPMLIAAGYARHRSHWVNNDFKAWVIHMKVQLRIYIKSGI